MLKKAAALRPAEAMLRIGATISVPAVLRSLGVEPEEVLSRNGLDLQLFDDPDNLISFHARGRLLADCVESTGCQHFGLLVGQQDGLLSIGLPGLLVKYSPDVGTALNQLVRYLHLHIRGATLTLKIEGGAAILGYEIHQPGAPAQDQLGDGALAMMHNIMCELCGADWKPIEAWFMHREPEDCEPFRRFFGVRLRFDAEQHALVFSSSWLNRRLPDAQPDVLRLLQKQVDKLAGRVGDDFPEQVRNVLRAALASGNVHANHVAALFAMHPRTLNRRLQRSETSFQQLLDETRFEVAQQLLTDSDLKISGIALNLHYADARAFIRAFRRWSGTTPARWRAAEVSRAYRSPKRVPPVDPGR